MSDDYLRAESHVKRALAVPCPVCASRPGEACRIVKSLPDEFGRRTPIAEVHYQRESVAYHRSKAS